MTNDDLPIEVRRHVGGLSLDDVQESADRMRRTMSRAVTFIAAGYAVLGSLAVAAVYARWPHWVVVAAVAGDVAVFATGIAVQVRARRRHDRFWKAATARWEAKRAEFVAEERRLRDDG